MAKTIAFDFDATIHPYTAGWTGSAPADEPPIPGALETIEALVGMGYSIVVFSTRCDHAEGKDGTWDWLEKWGFDVLVSEVTATKPAAIAYVDDRAVPFAGDWAAVMSGIAALDKGRAHGQPVA